jgi:predicted metalloprotease with PDZ domain
VDGVDPQVPLLSGIESSGWKLVYTNKPSRYQKALEDVGPGELEGSSINAMFSVGLKLDRSGKILDVLWQGPAFKAGMAPGMKLLAINDQAYSAQVLRAGIAQAQKTRKPLQIRAQADGVTNVYTVDYDGGLKYPHLVREQGTTDYLGQILAPKPVGNGS